MKLSRHIVKAGATVGFVMVFLSLSSCPNPFANDKHPTSRTTGSITVKAQRDANDPRARTLRPNADELQTAIYQYHLAGPDGAIVDGSDTTGTKTFTDLAAGSWTVAATAKNSSNVTLLSGTADFSISEGQTGSVVVQMDSATGTGAVSITLVLPTFVTSVTGTIQDEVNPGSPFVIDSKITFAPGNATYLDSLPAGSYLLVLNLNNNQNKVVGMIIEAVDVFADIATSPTLTIRDSDLNQPPVAPTGLIVDNPTLSSLTISWDTVLGATSYQLYRDDNFGGSFNTLVFDGIALGFTDTGLTAGTTYYYKVRATNPFGSSYLSAAVSNTTEPADVMIAINAAGDSFQMGDDAYGPQPNVTQTISYNYQISKYEITNAQFAAFIAEGGYSTQSYWTTNGWAWKGSTVQPGYWTDSNNNGPNQPVVAVSWYEAVAFCNWRSVQEELTPAYDSSGQVDLNASGYRLPTELEWEYAAAKGAPGQSERIYAYGNSWDASKVVDYYDNLPGTAVVGSLSPGGDTPQGLADMSGNVWEWCSDNWQADGSVASGTDWYYFSSDSTTQNFVFRGGARDSGVEYYFRSSYRHHQVPYYRSSAGFRIARSTSMPTPAAPSGLTASTLSTTSIHLSWTDNSINEAGFKIERSPNGSTGWTQIGTTGVGVSTFDDAGLNPLSTHYYRIKAYNDGGDSGCSNTASCAIPLASITMITINAAGDSFQMGDGSNGPDVTETISYDYHMSKFEITNALFAQFIADGGYNTQSYWTTNGWSYKQAQGWTRPGSWNDNNFNGTNQPIVGVTWYEAVAFCNWRSAKEGLTPAYDSAGEENLNADGYRLPTEVEWEYAAAKGAPGQAERIYAYGNSWDASKVVDLSDGLSGTANVGSLSPAGDTPQGLADMNGNAWEWCGDDSQSNGSIVSGIDRYYFTDDSTSQTVYIRGACWCDYEVNCFHSACRFDAGITFRDHNTGFRVARSVPGGSSGFAMTGGLLGDYTVTFTVTGQQSIPAPDVSGQYPVFTITQNALPITVSASSTPTVNTYTWYLNGIEQSTLSSIQLSSLAIQNHFLTLKLKKTGDLFRSATIILKVTD